MTTTIYKQLACKQDLARGKGKVTQRRNGRDVILDKINFSVSYDNLQQAIDADDLEVGDFIETYEYNEGTGIGGAKYTICENITTLNRPFVAYADHVMVNGFVLKLMSDGATVLAEQCGVTYDRNTIETDQLQASVDFVNEVRLASSNPEAGGLVKVNGHIKVDDTITRPTGRITFQGINAIASRVSWAGGSSTKSLFNLGSSSWGGFRDIRLNGYDALAGATTADGCAHLVTFTFTDLLLEFKGCQLMSGQQDIVYIETGAGENAITNLNFNDCFTSMTGSGSIVKAEAALGGRRPIGFYGCTLIFKSPTADRRV